MHSALITLASAALACAAPAAACSVVDTYRVPTNLELAGFADLVMLARVESGPAEPGPDAMMTVTPVEVLKGNAALGKPTQVMGSIAEPRFAVLSNPLQLDDAHPLAYIGACVRTMFVKEATVLFFLDRYDGKENPGWKGKLIPAGGAFVRWAEDVLSTNSPWVGATRTYLKVATMPKEQQAAALRIERDALLKLGDQDSKVIAEDIDRQLKGPSKPWNQRMKEEIKKINEREKRGEGTE